MDGTVKPDTCLMSAVGLARGPVGGVRSWLPGGSWWPNRGQIAAGRPGRWYEYCRRSAEPATMAPQVYGASASRSGELRPSPELRVELEPE